MNKQEKTATTSTLETLICFDGGTPCNIPAKGYGIGYGSYRINEEEVKRVNHGKPMSANAAEVWTLVRGLEELIANQPPEQTHLTISGDSQIALKWAGVSAGIRAGKLSKNVSPLFIEAIQALKPLLSQFLSVETQWRARKHSVALFGH